jgi:hypothetical protein
VYEPAFEDNITLKPNLANPDVWAIHGRGQHIVGNDYDFNNNPRPTTLTTGVPDMGAYEFLPTALPTILTATPRFSWYYPDIHVWNRYCCKSYL